MDPFNALAIATAVLQIIDFSGKLVSTFRELMKSDGVLTENLELETVTKDLSTLCQNITNTSHGTTPVDQNAMKDELALQELARQCKEVGNELLALLQDLRVSGKYLRLQTARQALRSLLKANKIEQYKSRLDRLQNQVQSHILSLMSNQQSSVLIKLKELALANKQLETNTIAELDLMRIELVKSLQQAQAVERSGLLADLFTRLSSFTLESETVAMKQAILSSLRFETMRMRHAVIKDATSNTFEWIHQHSGYSSWLHLRSGAFWIAGKAGSGKSTLMKYLCNHPKTMEGLRAWAGSEDFLLLNHFFWNVGFEIQKSQIGLLRSLLYQILRQRPVLIPEVCASRMTGMDHDDWDPSQQTWTIEELLDTFNLIAKQTTITTKFCFFIDGLDEYDGDKTDLIRLLEILCVSPNVKICTSSRPWNIFFSGLGQNPNRMLLVQDFTKNDIKRHTEFRLESSPRYVFLKARDIRYLDLIEDIVEQAQGVFLWVYLVVGSLLRGLEEHDEIDDLRRRLELLPKDLEQFFRHIFDAIEDAYQEQTAQIFLLSVQAVQPLPVMAFSFLEQESKNPEYALDAATQPFSESEIDLSYSHMRTRLNARCKDLLEINEYDEEVPFLRYRVDFLHRTVRDFLQTNAMQEMLKRRSSAKFDGRSSLCKIFLAQIKALPVTKGIGGLLNTLFSLVDEMLYYAGEVEAYSQKPELALLDELDRVISNYATDIASHWSNVRDPPEGLYEEYGYKNFLASAIQARLLLYVTNKLDSQPQLLREKKGRPLLDYALRPKVVTPIHLPYQDTNIDVSMVQFLLDRGANPNQQINIYDWRTVWDLFLVSCHVSSQERPTYDPRQNKIYQVSEMLIKRGADPNLKCHVGKASTMTARYKRAVDTEQILGVSEILKSGVNERDYKALEALLEEKRRSWQYSFYRLLGWS